MTISELSEQTGISVNLIEELEQNFTKIQSVDLMTIFKLSLILGCVVEDLIEI